MIFLLIYLVDHIDVWFIDFFFKKNEQNILLLWLSSI